MTMNMTTGLHRKDVKTPASGRPCCVRGSILFLMEHTVKRGVSGTSRLPHLDLEGC